MYYCCAKKKKKRNEKERLTVGLFRCCLCMNVWTGAAGFLFECHQIKTEWHLFLLLSSSSSSSYTSFGFFISFIIKSYNQHNETGFAVLINAEFDVRDTVVVGPPLSSSSFGPKCSLLCFCFYKTPSEFSNLYFSQWFSVSETQSCCCSHQRNCAVIGGLLICLKNRRSFLLAPAKLRS